MSFLQAGFEKCQSNIGQVRASEEPSETPCQ
jgi:hypothetical protein